MSSVVEYSAFLDQKMDKNLRTKVEATYLETLIQNHKGVGLSDVLNHVTKVAMTGANPFLNEVYFSSYFDKRKGKRVGATIFSYRFLMRRAAETGEYGGVTVVCEKGMYLSPSPDGLTFTEIETLKAVATVQRSRKVDSVYTAWFPEFAATKIDGTLNTFWRTKPQIMLSKCAIASAIRNAFPETMGAFYIQEEMSDESGVNDSVFEASVRRDADGAIQEEAAKQTKKLNDKSGLVNSICYELDRRTKQVSDIREKATYVQHMTGVQFSEIGTLPLETLQKIDKKLKEVR